MCVKVFDTILIILVLAGRWQSTIAEKLIVLLRLIM